MMRSTPSSRRLIVRASNAIRLRPSSVSGLAVAEKVQLHCVVLALLYRKVFVVEGSRPPVKPRETMLMALSLFNLFVLEALNA